MIIIKIIILYFIQIRHTDDFPSSITKHICIFHDFGILDLRTTEPVRSNCRTFLSDLRTFGLNNLRTHEPSNLRTFGLMRWNRPITSSPPLPVHFYYRHSSLVLARSFSVLTTRPCSVNPLSGIQIPPTFVVPLALSFLYCQAL